MIDKIKFNTFFFHTMNESFIFIHLLHDPLEEEETWDKDSQDVGETAIV